ncbi:hypothetical protein HK105_202239 [Polyrhizophydium stewartii]|uniref:Uncharacterized protein n=1 Tax=Polyrhizophydium stewartii TaxID=2732419 RepID=A0ABR4NFN0_9FUNG
MLSAAAAPAGTPSTGDLLPAAEYPVSLRARRASRRSAALDDAGAGSGSGSGDDRRGRSDRGDGGRDDGSRGRGLLDDAPASRAAVLGDSAVRAGLASDPPERVASSDHVRASSAGPGDAAAEGCAAADAPHGLEGVPLQDAPSLVDDVIDSILTPGLSPRLQLVMHACFALLVATLLALLFVSGLNPHVAVLLSVAVMLWASTAWFLSNLHSLSPGAPDPAESRKAI